jgi:hypothetical protein
VLTNQRSLARASPTPGRDSCGKTPEMARRGTKPRRNGQRLGIHTQITQGGHQEVNDCSNGRG